MVDFIYYKIPQQEARVTSFPKLEGEVHQRLRRAVENKQYADVDRLNAIAMRLAEMEAEIQAELEDIEQLLSGVVTTTQSGTSPVVEMELAVTQGDINARLLRVAKLRDRHLIPHDSAQFTVVAVYGDREVPFETGTDPTQTRLTERGEIGRFYTINGICAGDCVLWRQIEARKFRLSKVRKSNS